MKLKNATSSILDFIHSSMSDFRRKEGKFTSVGIYSCPWSGWIMICFNKNKTVEDVGSNCPDFEYVDFRQLELPDWKKAYEHGEKILALNGKEVNVGDIEGSDEFNKIFFEYLIEIILNDHELSLIDEEIFIQMLDSEYEMVVNKPQIFKDCIVETPMYIPFLSFISFSKKTHECIEITPQYCKIGQTIIQREDILKINIYKPKNILITRSSYGVLIMLKEISYFIYVKGLKGYPNMSKTNRLITVIQNIYRSKVDAHDAA